MNRLDQVVVRVNAWLEERMGGSMDSPGGGGPCGPLWRTDTLSVGQSGAGDLDGHQGRHLQPQQPLLSDQLQACGGDGDLTFGSSAPG